MAAEVWFVSFWLFPVLVLPLLFFRGGHSLAIHLPTTATNAAWQIYFLGGKSSHRAMVQSVEALARHFDGGIQPPPLGLEDGGLPALTDRATNLNVTRIQLPECEQRLRL